MDVVRRIWSIINEIITNLAGKFNWIRYFLISLPKYWSQCSLLPNFSLRILHAPVMQRSWVQIPFKTEFLSGFNIAAAKSSVDNCNNLRNTISLIFFASTIVDVSFTDRRHRNCHFRIFMPWARCNWKGMFFPASLLLRFSLHSELSRRFPS